ncbi:MAG: tetratricopeptide repeat protein [Mariprofundales bacterium]|nr:tetratricopeptide repeat protein [Mariprofundales bacterium]
MKSRALITTITALTAALWSISTATAADNAVLGALIGAGTGAAIGHQVNRRGGAGQGAIIGALGGYLLGKQVNNGAQAAPAPVQATPRSFDDCSAAAREYEQAKPVIDREKKVYLLQNSVRLCTGSALYHNDLGVAYYQRGRSYDRQRARAEFNQALRIDPNYQSARQNLNSL